MVVAKTKIGNLEEENKNLKVGKETAASAGLEEKIQELETALAKSKTELEEKSQEFEKLLKQRETDKAAMEQPHTSAQPSETVTGMVKPVVSVSGGQQPRGQKPNLRHKSNLP